MDAPLARALPATRPAASLLAAAEARPRLVLVLFCLLLWLPGFFTLPAGDRDESRFAQATKQMIETGDYVRIMNGTEPRNRKPIGIHWLQLPFAAAARGLGLAEANPIWPYRLPSLLGGLLAVLATEGLGRALVGRRAALLAAGMLGASVILVTEVHIAKTDAALLGATTLAMGLLGRAYLVGGAAAADRGGAVRDRSGGAGPGGAWGARGAIRPASDAAAPDAAAPDAMAPGAAAQGAVARVPAAELPGRAASAARFGPGSAAAFWLAVGAGILLKGPITPMVAGLAALVLVAWDRRAGWLRLLRPSWGVPLMVLAVLPWFVAIGLATEGRFFADAVGGDLGRKLTSGDDAHGAPPGLHLLLLPLLAFPATVPVLRALPLGWRALRDGAPPATRFLVAWAVPSWLVMEAVPTKLPHYTLPLYPALFLLAAGFLLAPARLGPRLAGAGPRWMALLSVALLVLAGAVLGIGGAALPVATGAASWTWGLLSLAAAVAVAGVAAWAAIRGAWRRSAALWGLAAMPLLTWALLGLDLPRAAPLWISPRVAAELRAHPHPGGFGAVGYHEPSLMFLAGTATQFLATGTDGADFLAAGADRAVAIGDRDEAAFAAEAARRGLQPHAFAEVDGFNYSRGRRVRLVLYDR